MKRTSLFIEENLLKEAKRLLNADTNSTAVNLALEQLVGRAKIRGLAKLIGKGVWDGDLWAMRDDAAKPRAKPRGKR